MKNKNSFKITLALLAAMVVLSPSCKKGESKCTTHTQLSGRAHTIDMGLLNAEAPEIGDTLDNTPALQAYNIENNNSSCIVHCRIFYKDLMVFTDYRTYRKSKSDGSVTVLGDAIVDTITVSPIPGLHPEMAIARAHHEIDFGIWCTDYRLGYWNINAGNSLAPADYRLVWNITSSPNNALQVVIDAHTGVVYYKDDGVRTVM